MKHLQKLPFGFLIAMVLLLSCQEDSFLSEWNKTTENPLVTEARQFFEETIYEAALQGAIVQDIGWSPGEVTPCWKEASIKQDKKFNYVFVPIYAQNQYLGQERIMKDSIEQAHLVRVTQLICIRKNIEGNHSVACLTFIPSKDYYSTHKNRIIDIFLENKEDYYGDFTGRVIYSDLVTSQLMAIDKVANGKFEWGFSRKNTPEIEDFKFNFLEMFKDISIFGVIGTRTNLDGGELEEVQCVYCTKCNKQVEPNHRCPADGNNSSGWNYGDSSGDNNYGGGSNGNWGDWGSSGSGGTGSSGNNGNGQNTNSPQDPAFEMLIIQLKYHLDKKGMNTGKYKVVKGIECSAYARVIDEKIEICQLFAEKEFKDQVAILGHEIYHNENDDNSWVREVKPLPFQLQLKLPPEHEKYVREYLVEKEMQYYPEELRNEEREKTYNEMTKYNFIKDPRYYQNEINAYTWEINTFMDVTPEYDAERRYRLWEYTQLKPYADQYHR